ncbi:MAG: HAD family phosphatase [Candidatus Saccharimonadales bacterium]
MIKAIIFDCFGVLTSDTLLELLRERVHDEADWQELWRRDDQVNQGEISFDEYVEYVGSLVGLSRDETRQVFGTNSPNQRLLAYVRTLAPQYKLAMLSNMAHDSVDELIGAENRKLFDIIILSCDVGMVKPDPQMYLKCAEALGCQPEECLFVDDKARYCEPARALGMQTIVYDTFSSFQTDCDKLRGGAVQY